MPVADIGGIATRYEVAGSGPPLLMFSPGGFNAAAENWAAFGLYQRLRLLDELTHSYTCITFDRRESGASGGRVERITWGDYAAQGKGLLDHLGIGRAHLMGGCAGCSVAAVFAVTYPEAAASMVLYSPAGGARYRIPPAREVRAASGLCRRTGVAGGHRAGPGRHGRLHRGSAGRPVGDGHPVRPRIRGGIRAPGPRPVRHDRGRNGPAAVRPRHRPRSRAGRPAEPRHPRAGRPGPGRLARHLGIPALVVPGQDASHATSASPRWSSRARTPRTPPPPPVTSRSACPGPSTGMSRSASRPGRRPRPVSFRSSPRPLGVGLSDGSASRGLGVGLSDGSASAAASALA